MEGVTGSIPVAPTIFRSIGYPVYVDPFRSLSRGRIENAVTWSPSISPATRAGTSLSNRARFIVVVRSAGGAAEYIRLAAQLSSVRFHSGLDLCFRGRCVGWRRAAPSPGSHEGRNAGSRPVFVSPLCLLALAIFGSERRAKTLISIDRRAPSERFDLAGIHDQVFADPFPQPPLA